MTAAGRLRSSASADCDVAIIGAGAAGIAAARRLIQRGLAVTVLEARERVGGRAFTATTRLGLPVDLGCEWLHSADRNPWTAIAGALGFSIARKLPDWGRLRRMQGGDRENADWQAASDAYHAALAAAAGDPADPPAATLLPSGGRWNGLLDAVSTWANGVELAGVSPQDQARYADSGINWRLREGYGALIAAAAGGLPVRLGARVERVDHGGRTVRIATTRGSLRAAGVLVTLPTALIAAETVRFTPPLPQRTLAAAHGVPLGLANKLFLALAGPPPDLPPDSHVLGATDRRATGSYQLRPHGRPLVAAYFGGELARALESAGPAAMAAFAIGELAGLFGGALRRRLSPLAASAWAGDPYARGSYSCALPGHAGDRAVLAESAGERIVFAGEACSSADFSTAHGAYQSGRAAADSLADALSKGNRRPPLGSNDAVIPPGIG